MFLIVGLGNSGTQYEGTPHNAGFIFVDYLYELFGWDSLYQVADWSYDKYLNAEVLTVRVGAEPRIILLKPTTMMNRSGMAVKNAVDKFEIDIKKELVLVHDDLDMPLGTFKLQRMKFPKAHNGVNNVQNILGELDFLRIRIGIENRTETDKTPGEDYVLKTYSEDEIVLLRESLADAAKMFRSHLTI